MDMLYTGKSDTQRFSPITKTSLLDYFVPNLRQESLLSPTIELTPIEIQEKIQPPKAMSAGIKGKKGTLYEVQTITDMRTVKGKIEYKVQWINHEATWEAQKLIEEDIRELVEQFTNANTEQKQSIELLIPTSQSAFVPELKDEEVIVELKDEDLKDPIPSSQANQNSDKKGSAKKSFIKPNTKLP